MTESEQLMKHTKQIHFVTSQKKKKRQIHFVNRTPPFLRALLRIPKANNKTQIKKQSTKGLFLIS